MPNIHLTMAMNDYDHIRDIVNGVVRPQGIEITGLTMQVEEIFFRFLRGFEWDISEMSFGKFCGVMSQPNPPIVGIPVFPSRVFRQSGVFVNRKGKVKKAADLKGKRIGIPEWSQTATIYMRGWLQHDLGAPLTGIKWFRSGINEPGRIEVGTYKYPKGITITQVTDRSLAQMLVDGDLDAVFTAHPPRLFEEGHPDIVRLFPDYQKVEQEYFEKTGVYPIMHTVAVKREVYEKHPWVLGNLMNAFEEAKQRSVHRITEMTASQIAVPWGPDFALRTAKKIFGDKGYWPYGIEANRTTIATFLQFCYEQGVCHKKMKPEDLYPHGLDMTFKI